MSDDETRPLLSGPKRQHFLPRFYLEGFANDSVLSVFDRTQNQIRVQQPVNTGVIGHFYTLEDSEGRKRFELEQMLSEYEGKASVAINKLVRREELSDDERCDLAIFIALADARTPDMVDSIKAVLSGIFGKMSKWYFSEVGRVKEGLRRLPDASADEQELERQAQELVELANSGQYQIVADHQRAISLSIQTAFDIAPALAGRDWSVLHQDDAEKSFVTSDAPVLLTSLAPRNGIFSGVGYGSPDAIVFFPLTATSLLVLCGGDGSLTHGTIRPERVRDLNRKLANHSQRFVIGRDEALVQSLVKELGLEKKTWKPKFRMD